MSGTLPAAAADARAQAAHRWACAQLGLRDAEFVPASADASFRRYFRLTAGTHSWIVMDAPPVQEDCTPFLRVARLLREAGVHAPEVLAQDLASGFLLLTDLGTQTYLEVLDERNADPLFADALAALIRWQRASRHGVLSPYDEALLRRELALFSDWYLTRHLNVQLEGAARVAWDATCERLVAAALAQPQVYVHRDYMPRNLMVSTPNPGVLDFQDAVYGPLAYDPLCLFKDAFLSWPETRVRDWLRDYWERARAAELPVSTLEHFLRDADWIGVQRHLKVLGIFARLHYRDGKPQYLADTPRFVRYVVAAASRYAEFEPLLRLFEQHVLPNVTR